MAIHPCAWNQVVHPVLSYPTDCRATWLQNGWLTFLEEAVPGRGEGMILGREDVASAIATAEEQIGLAAGFPPAPTWTSADERAWPYPKRGDQVEYPPIFASSGMVITPGIEAFTLVAHNAPIVYSDRDGDGVVDTAQIAITAAQLAAANASWYELAVYYPTEYLDEYFYARDDTWRIRPLNLVPNSVTGGVTIWGHRAQFVQPELWLAADDIVQSIDANFLAYVDVYRRYTSNAQEGQIVYRSGVGNVCSTSASCAESCQVACVQITDERLGEVRVIPSTYSAGTYTASALTDAPHAVRLWYLSGYYRPRNGFSSWVEADVMESQLAKAITLLSLAYLPDALCGCSQTRSLYERYREEQSIDSLDAAMAQTYFGVVTKGSVFAASIVRRMNPIQHGGNL